MKYFDEKGLKLPTLVMLVSTFLLGYLNSYSLIFNESTLFSAQTGNLINLGIKLANGNLKSMQNNITLLTAFAIGCFASFLIIKKMSPSIKNLMINWSLFSSIIWGCTLFTTRIGISLNIFLLSMASGMALNFFRDMKGTSLNNGIMTGNLKNMFASLANVIIFKQPDQAELVKKYFVIGLIFFFGAFVGGMVANLGKIKMLTVASLLCGIPYVFYAQMLVYELYKKRNIAG